MTRLRSEELPEALQFPRYVDAEAEARTRRQAIAMNRILIAFGLLIAATAMIVALAEAADLQRRADASATEQPVAP